MVQLPLHEQEKWAVGHSYYLTHGQLAKWVILGTHTTQCHFKKYGFMWPYLIKWSDPGISEGKWFLEGRSKYAPWQGGNKIIEWSTNMRAKWFGKEEEGSEWIWWDMVGWDRIGEHSGSYLLRFIWKGIAAGLSVCNTKEFSKIKAKLLSLHKQYKNTCTFELLMIQETRRGS